MNEIDYEKRLQARMERELMESLDRREAIQEYNRMWGRIVTVLVVVIVLLLLFW